MTQYDDRPNDGPNSSAEAERDVAEARADLEGSLDELSRLFDPDTLMARAKAYVAGDGERFGDVVIREARANPVAAVMAGTGLAWLLLGARRRIEERRAYGRAVPPPASRPVPPREPVPSEPRADLGSDLRADPTRSPPPADLEPLPGADPAARSGTTDPLKP